MHTVNSVDFSLVQIALLSISFNIIFQINIAILYLNTIIQFVYNNKQTCNFIIISILCICRNSFTGYDIGLIKLKTPLNFTKEVQAIELPPAESEPTRNVYLCGWGAVSLNQQIVDAYYNFPDELRHAKIIYIDNHICNFILSLFITKHTKVVETNICTVSPANNPIGACSVSYRLLINSAIVHTV